jgi:hypothetical protein
VAVKTTRQGCGVIIVKLVVSSCGGPCALLTQ